MEGYMYRLNGLSFVKTTDFFRLIKVFMLE